MNAPNRRSNAQAEAMLGDDALQAAEVLVSMRLPNDAVSRAYYAVFHFARAVLLSQGAEAKTHRGLVSMLAERADEPGWLSGPAVSALARLQTFRGVADYDARSRLPLERAAEEVSLARKFVDDARVLLRRAGCLPNDGG